MKHPVLACIFLLTCTVAIHAEWENGIEAGYSKTTGNSETENLYIAANSRYKKGIYSASVKLKLDQQTTSGDKTKEYRLIDAKASRFFSQEKTAYGFTNARWEQDKPAGLNNNWVVTVGPGFQWRWPEKNELSAELGLGYQSTDYQDNTKDFQGSVGRLFGHYTRSFNKSVTFSAETLFLVDEIRLRNTSNLTLESILTQRLSLKASYEYRHNSQPENHKKKDDTTVRLTLKYSFSTSAAP